MMKLESSKLIKSPFDDCPLFGAIINVARGPPGGVLFGIRGGGVPPGSPNPYPISDQNMPFSIPVFKPVL